jgi:hypothetical protein
MSRKALSDDSDDGAMEPRVRKLEVGKVLLVLRLITITVCIFIAFGGHHPPSYAQTPQRLQYVPVITAEDAVQDNNIVALNEHLRTTDATVKEQWKAVYEMEGDLSGLRGEERIIGAVLGIIASSSVFLQWRKRPA